MLETDCQMCIRDRQRRVYNKRNEAEEEMTGMKEMCIRDRYSDMTLKVLSPLRLQKMMQKTY